MLSSALEDWLTEEGDRVVRKLAADEASLSSAERLIYEVWLLDTEARNGGLSQYFANRGLEQWQSCLAVCEAASLLSFASFAEAVGEVIANASDPYDAVIVSGPAGENLWYTHQEHVVGELHAICTNAL